MSLTHTKHGDASVTWWAPDDAGYVQDLRKAGRYAAETIQDRRWYYDNRRTTVALPCDAVDVLIRHVLPADAVAQILSARLGRIVRVEARPDSIEIRDL